MIFFPSTSEGTLDDFSRKSYIQKNNSRRRSTVLELAFCLTTRVETRRISQTNARFQETIGLYRSFSRCRFDERVDRAFLTGDERKRSDFDQFLLRILLLSLSLSLSYAFFFSPLIYLSRNKTAPRQTFKR